MVKKIKMARGTTLTFDEGCDNSVGKVKKERQCAAVFVAHCRLIDFQKPPLRWC